jgi:WD40 repeat protein
MNFNTTIKFIQAGAISCLISNSSIGQNPFKKAMEIVPGDYYTVSFSPDSKYVVGTSFSNLKYSETLTMRAGGTQVFNIETGVKELAITDRPALCAVFRPDGKEILSAELSNGPRTFSFKDGAEKSIKSQNEEVTFTTLYSENGMDAITGTVKGNVYITDIATGKLKNTIKTNDSAQIVISLHLFNNGKNLITHSAGAIQFWDLASGKLTKYYTPANGKSVSYVAVSGDKKTMISQSGKTVSIWNLETMDIKITFETSWKYCGAISPDGSLIALGFDGGFYTFNNKGEVIRGWGGDDVDVKSLSFSPDGKLCAAGLSSGRLYIFDAAVLATSAE